MLMAQAAPMMPNNGVSTTKAKVLRPTPQILKTITLSVAPTATNIEIFKIAIPVNGKPTTNSLINKVGEASLYNSWESGAAMNSIKINATRQKKVVVR
jgi:hypothetical protein